MSHFYGTRKFVCVHKRQLDINLNKLNPVHTFIFHFTGIHFNIHFYVQLSSPSDQFNNIFQAKPCTHLISTMHASYSDQHIFLI